jgi:RNA polymerase sigma-70 factor (ECF subfamily)
LNFKNFQILEENAMKNGDKNKIRTTNYDGTISEIEVSGEVYEYDKNFNSKENYHEHKKRPHSDGRKYEVSFEEICEFNENVCNFQALPEEMTSKSAENEYMKDSNLELALDELPDVQRRRLLLHFRFGLTQSEIAKAENISKMAVNYSIKSAIKNLKKILSKFKF